MTYPDAIQFLYGLRLFGAKLGLDTTRRLAALSGNPQDRLRFIHVAGTNGKGSVCAMLESIYRAAGLRVGLYTSPHLVAFGERIQVDRRPISEADVARLVDELRSCFSVFPADHSPTFFEVVTAMALRHFAEQQCELVIWETGLGGRLDATNIVTPLASVITNVQFDHQQWLGETHAQIATEKAGIIKPGVPVLTATDEPEALAVIKARARELNAPLTRITAPSEPPPATGARALIPSLSPNGREGARRAGEGERVPTGPVRGIPDDAHPSSASKIPSPPLPSGLPELPLLGDHQRTNAALALATVRVLQGQIPVSDDALRRGLQQVHWPGRLQLVRLAGGRKILFDGAHNVAGAVALRAALGKHFPGAKPALVLGVLADKDWPAICDLIAPLARRICLVPVGSMRTTDPATLATACQQANPAAQVTVHASAEDALAQTADEPFVLVTGSLYLVGEAMERLGLSPAKPTNERGLNEWTTR